MQLRKDYLEAGIDIRNGNKLSSEMPFHETPRELESHRLQLHQAFQRADQVQRRMRQSSSPAPNSKTKTDGEIQSESSGNRGESP